MTPPQPRQSPPPRRRELRLPEHLPAGSMQHDIVREPALRIIADQIFEDAFEGG